MASNNHAGYLEKLVNAFKPAATTGVMCHSTLPAGWDGTLHDCDFSRMLDLPMATPGRHIRDFGATLSQHAIVVDQHCYVCTAGASCGATA